MADSMDHTVPVTSAGLIWVLQIQFLQFLAIADNEEALKKLPGIFN